MSDRYRIADSDNRGEHARLTRPILVLITVLIQSVIATRVTRDDKLPDKLSGFSTFFSFLSLSLFSSSSTSPFPSFPSFFPSFCFWSTCETLSASSGETLGYSLHSAALHESQPLNWDQRRRLLFQNLPWLTLLTGTIYSGTAHRLRITTYRDILSLRSTKVKFSLPFAELIQKLSANGSCYFSIFDLVSFPRFTAKFRDTGQATFILYEDEKELFWINVLKLSLKE